MTHTHSHVILEISQVAYQEIRASLEKAGYQHAFKTDSGRDIIDLHGVAVAMELELKPKVIFVNGNELPFTEDNVTYEKIVDLAYTNLKPWNGWTMTYHGKFPGGGVMSGILSHGKSIRVLDRMVFSVVDTSNA